MARILVIDDEPLVLKTVKAFLEHAGHHVVEACDGRTGVDLFAQESFDLVIADILMPGREGIETIAILRGLKPAAKILAMSGGGRTGSIEFLSFAAKDGAGATIKKPFSRSEFMEKVSSLLG